jgi:vitamin B12 transporter
MSNPLEMDGYHTIDFYAQYHFNSKFKAFADFKNITDQQYFDIRGYESRRFNFMAGISVDL